MNKAQLVDKISEQTKQTKTSVEETINAAIEVIKEAVKNGDDVTLLGFGTFTQSTRKARNGRDPRSGEPITIPAMVIPRFRPGKEFRKLFSHSSPGTA